MQKVNVIFRRDASSSDLQSLADSGLLKSPTLLERFKIVSGDLVDDSAKEKIEKFLGVEKVENSEKKFSQ